MSEKGMMSAGDQVLKYSKFMCINTLIIVLMIRAAWSIFIDSFK